MAVQGDIPKKLVQSISSVLIGKEEQVSLVVCALLAGGHVLIEDIPGVGKTLLALATARSTGVRFRRIQFTSDTLPSDVIGVNVFNPKTSEFEFKSGPLFTEVLLADEINRTSPRTQSALMEAMAEGKVSLDGTTYELAKPFLVLATMNPIERFGSFELPESQSDRFMISISLGYPDRSHELEILNRDLEHSHAEDLQPVTDPKAIRALQQEVARDQGRYERNGVPAGPRRSDAGKSRGPSGLVFPRSIAPQASDASYGSAPRPRLCDSGRLAQGVCSCVSAPGFLVRVFSSRDRVRREGAHARRHPPFDNRPGVSSGTL